MSNVFDDYIKANNFDINSNNFSYTHPIFINEERFFSAIDDIKLNNKKVMIFGDCDPDGLLCAMQVRELFDRLGHTNYTVWDYKKRDHHIDEDCIYKCIEDRYDYVIILDVGTNEMDKIKTLTTFGVNVIIIDHHVGNYSFEDYNDKTIIINSKMNNVRDDRFLYILSAGALTFTLIYKYGSLRKLNLEYLSIYGLITLYSDSIDMSYDLNKAIYKLATNQPLSVIPYFVKDFMYTNASFRRRFIEFTLVPKINSLFRAEEFELINAYFYNSKLSTIGRNKILDRIKTVYTEKKKVVNMVTDLVKREVLQNFVIANLSSSGIETTQSKLYNYTGIIANNLSQEYGKPCIVLCDDGSQIKGSFRDTLGRNYLEVFKQFCRCGGHPAAFGLHIGYMELSNFLDLIKYTIDKKFSIYGFQENLVIEMNDSSPDVRLLNRIAEYNEFSGGKMTVALVKKRNLMREISSYKKDYYTYVWGDVKVDSNYKLVMGSYIQIKPVITSGLKLITYVRG